MDFHSARAQLPGMTRAMFGELVSVIPMAQGKMAEAPDTDRAVLANVPARFDFVPDAEELGGGRERLQPVSLMGEKYSVSFERKRLPYPLREGDRISRVEKHSGSTEIYRVIRFGRALPAIVLAYLSRVS